MESFNREACFGRSLCWANEEAAGGTWAQSVLRMFTTKSLFSGEMKGKLCTVVVAKDKLANQI